MRRSHETREDRDQAQAGGQGLEMKADTILLAFGEFKLVKRMISSTGVKSSCPRSLYGPRRIIFSATTEEN